jgi:alpha-acetolactate decarboxylase
VVKFTTFLIILIGKIYEALKKEEHRPSKENKVANFATFSGHHATAKTIASFQKVDEKIRGKIFPPFLDTIQPQKHSLL